MCQLAHSSGTASVRPDAQCLLHEHGHGRLLRWHRGPRLFLGHVIPEKRHVTIAPGTVNLKESQATYELFRAVSVEEEQDIRASGGFRAARGTMETKLFALSAEEAAAVGRALFELDRRPFTLVEARVPVIFAERLEHLIVDGRLTVAVAPDQLTDLNRLATVRTLTAIPCEAR